VTRFVWLLLAAAGSGACHEPPASKHFGERFYSGGADTRRVQCSKGIDRTHEWPHAELAASLEYARTHDLVLHTYGHAPTLDLNEYLTDFDWAAAHGVRMVTFRDLAGGYHGPGWAFTVDDDEVDAWFAWRDVLRAHGVHVTFFVTNFAKLTPAQRGELHTLAADGHDIEAHSATHANALDYIAAHDLPSYLRDEALPSQALVAADGLPAPVAFSYPYGAHTAALDAALLPHFALLRTTGAQWCLKDSP
jgi:peptidoglycan/xylan/chitin deacetylase (PgdA/CDA1 family)